MRRQRPAHPYSRVTRVSELVHQILADELERIDDERLELVTVMSVSMDTDLRRAMVAVDNPDGYDGDLDVLRALEEHRRELQAAMARQARLRYTPTLSFAPDEVGRSARHIESLLRAIPEVAAREPDHADEVVEPERLAEG
jgi:ribosome-binding factor A